MNLFEMISGVGNSFSKSYEAAKKDALTSELGEKIRTGDYTGAAEAALRGGDLKTGLELVKMGEARGADSRFQEGLGSLFGGGTSGGSAAPGGFGERLTESYRGGGASKSATPFRTDDPVAEGLLPHQKALLNGIAGPESAGRYNVRFTPRGGALFEGFSQHPGIAEMGPAGPSTAAGRYQFTKTTWDGMGGGDFSPANQDRRALQLATQDYRSRTGRDLEADLQAEGFSPRIQRALAPTWTGLGSNQERNAATYAESLSRYGITPGGATQTASDGLPSPRRSSVAVANSEAEVQALEREMGMLPPGRRQVAVSGMNPDAANRPAPGAMPMGFQIPEGQSQGPPALGRPGPSDASLSGVGAAGSSAEAQTGAGSAPAGGLQIPTPETPGLTLPPAVQMTAALAQAGVPLRQGMQVARMAPGSPERVQALIRLSLIPGLSEQKQGLIKTLLGNELEQSKLTPDQRDYAFAQSQGYQGGFVDFKRGDEGAKITSQVTAREREVRARGLDPNEPANRRYILTGSMPEDRSRSQVVEARDGQRYVVNPDDPSADPRRLNIPSAGIRLWGSTGPDGQIVQPPPNVPPGTAGYFDEKGEPQLIVGKGVNVTTNVGAGETEEAKKLGGLRGERAASIESAGMKAPEQIAKLNLLERSLQGVRTGTLGPIESTAVGFAQSLGIPDETIAGLGLKPRQAIDAQTATKLINESIVGMIGAGGFPANNFSNADREFLTDIFPKISNRPEANQTAIEVLRRIQGRNLEVADAWAEYQQAQREARKPLSVQEFEFNFRKAQRGKPDLFADIRQQADAAPAGRGGEGGTGGGSPPPAFDPRTSKISMEDGKALTSAPDTAENRRLFDERYGAGAADFVLRDRPSGGDRQPASATADAPKAIARGSSRQTMPRGYTSDRALFDARQAIRDGRDRGVIEDRLRAYGIDPAALDR